MRALPFEIEIPNWCSLWQIPKGFDKYGLNLGFEFHWVLERHVQVWISLLSFSLNNLRIELIHSYCMSLIVLDVLLQEPLLFVDGPPSGERYVFCYFWCYNKVFIYSLEPKEVVQNVWNSICCNDHNKDMLQIY